MPTLRNILPFMSISSHSGILLEIQLEGTSARISMGHQWAGIWGLPRPQWGAVATPWWGVLGPLPHPAENDFKVSRALSPLLKLICTY